MEQLAKIIEAIARDGRDGKFPWTEVERRILHALNKATGIEGRETAVPPGFISGRRVPRPNLVESTR